MEVIWQVRLCEIVSVSCNATMDAHSRRHQRQAAMRGYTCARMYAAVFQIILHWQVGQPEAVPMQLGQAVPIVGAS